MVKAAYIAALILVGFLTYFIEKRFKVPGPFWLLPGALFLLGFVLAIISSHEPVDLGPMLLAMFVVWPVAASVFVGGLLGRAERNRKKTDQG